MYAYKHTLAARFAQLLSRVPSAHLYTSVFRSLLYKWRTSR